MRLPASGTLWAGCRQNTVISAAINRENQSAPAIDLCRYGADKVRAAQSSSCAAQSGRLDPCRRNGIILPREFRQSVRHSALSVGQQKSPPKGTVERAELIPAKTQPKRLLRCTVCTYDLGVHTRPCRQPVAAKAIATPLVTLYSRRDRDDTAGPAIGPRYGQRSETSRYSNPGTPAWPIWSRLAGDGLCPERIAA